MQNQRLEWLKPKMDTLFDVKAKQESKGTDFNTSIQAGREFRNPRICEKLIEALNIKQYGTNFSPKQFDPDQWRRKPEEFSDYRRLLDQGRKRNEPR